MRLVSCPECAVVIDESKLYYLQQDNYGYTEEYTLSTEETEYENGEFYLAIICPVCKEKFASTFKPK